MLCSHIHFTEAHCICVQNVMWMLYGTQQQWECVSVAVCCQCQYYQQVQRSSWPAIRKKLFKMSPNIGAAAMSLISIWSVFSWGLWRVFHMQAPLPYCPPTAFLFPNPLIPSPPHWRQQCPSHRNTPLSTGFCGIYSNILTFRLLHFPSRNDLWQLEMGSVGGASSYTRAFFFFPLSFFVERPFFFSFSASRLFAPPVRGLESSSPSFLCDSTVWKTNRVIFCYLLTFCLLTFFFSVCFSVTTCCLILCWHHVLAERRVILHCQSFHPAAPGLQQDKMIHLKRKDQNIN